MAKVAAELQHTMTTGAGVVRTEESLSGAREALRGLLDATPRSDDRAAAEVRNLLAVGLAVVTAGLARTESRGCHWRDDHPETDPGLRVRLVRNR